MIPRLAYLTNFHILPIALNHFSHGMHPVRHFHDHAFSEIVFILNGNMKHLCSNQQHQITAGDILLLHPGKAHAYEHDRQSLELINILYDSRRLILPCLDLTSCSLFERFFPKSYDSISDSSAVSPILHLEPGEMNQMRSLLSLLENELNSLCSGHVFGAMTAFMQILLTLCRHGTADHGTMAHHEIVTKAIQFMNQHYAEPIKIEKIAAHAGVSLRNLYRFFRIVAGCSPCTYLIQLRVGNAMKLLTNSKLNISEIAYQCGFTDGNYLSKKFREITGMSPSSFRLNPKLSLGMNLRD